jgi:hypothetical protein
MSLIFGAMVVCCDVRMDRSGQRKTCGELTVAIVYGGGRVVEKKEIRAWRLK